MEGLSRKAIVVLGIIRRLQKASAADGKKYCFAGQQRIATESGWSVPSVRRAVRELENAGALLVERTNRTNHYYAVGDTAQNERSEPLKMSDPDRSKRAIRTAQNERSEPGAPLVESLRVTAAANAAAVLLETSPPSQAAAELVEFGLPSPQAAAVEPSLAKATVQAVRERLANPKLKPVGNVTGLIVRWLQNPEFYGFSRDPEGTWQPPGRVAQAKPPPNYLDRTMAANRAAAAESKRKSEEAFARKRRLEAIWDALPLAERERRRARICEEKPLFATPEFRLHARCLDELEDELNSPLTQKGP